MGSETSRSYAPESCVPGIGSWVSGSIVNFFGKFPIQSDKFNVFRVSCTLILFAAITNRHKVTRKNIKAAMSNIVIPIVLNEINTGLKRTNLDKYMLFRSFILKKPAFTSPIKKKHIRF